MMRRIHPILWLELCSLGAFFCPALGALGDEPGDLKQQLEQLREQNRLLQQQLQQQQQMIDQLNRKFADLQRAND